MLMQFQIKKNSLVEKYAAIFVANGHTGAVSSAEHAMLYCYVVFDN